MSDYLTKDNIRELIALSSSVPETPVVERKDYLNWLDLSYKSDLVKVITGFRRVGKSFLLKLFTQKLTEDNKSPLDNIFFLNFELDRIKFINKVETLREIFDFYEGNLVQNNEPITLFLDEVQNVKGWESFVRTLHEQKKYQIYISGSNSTLLSSELGTALSGRFIDLKIFPFSFREYCRLLGKESALETNYYGHTSEMFKLFKQYLENGGLPEDILLLSELKQSYINNLFLKVLIDDIGKRYRIRNLDSLEKVFKFIAGNVGGITSLRKVAKNIDVSAPTAGKHISYFEDAYGIFSLPKFSWKLHAIFEGLNKYYLIDNGLFKIAASQVDDDKKVENAVFLALKRMHPQQRIFYGRDDKGKEIDFLIELKNRKYAKFQVTNVLHDQNAKREIGNLQLANKYLEGPNYLLYLQDLRKVPKEIEQIKLQSVLEFIQNS